MEALKVGTDFSGLGSPEEALKRLGIEHSLEFACERDKYARQSYLANHSPKIFYDDVTTRDNSKAGYVDMYVFGFPCQAFSMAGKRLGFQETRGTLFFNSLDYINQNRPRVFIAENVKGLLSHDKKKGSKGKYGNTFNTIIDCLALTANGQYNLHKYDDCVNYHVVYAVINTKNYGIPQNRERIFIVGFRDEQDAANFQMPKPFELKLKLKDMLQDNPDSKYFLTDKEAARVNKFDGKYTNVQSASTASTLISRYPGNQNGNYITYEVDEKYYLSDKMLAWLIFKDAGNQLGYINQDTQASKVTKTDDIIDTLCAGSHGYANGYLAVKEATNLGYAVAASADSINLSNPNSLTRRGRVGVGVANTLDTTCNQAVVIDKPLFPDFTLIEHRGHTNKEPRIIHNGIVPTLRAQSHGHETKVYQNYRIRRLTPRECFRLMGYTDAFFDNCQAIQSDTQLYKQAGNSIVVDTILGVINNILVAIGYDQNRL